MPAILSIGAEATLEKVKVGTQTLLKKTRVPKGYRNAHLDARLRKERTTSEARLLHEAKKCGVRTPLLYAADSHEHALYIEFIPGERLKHFLLKKNAEKDKAHYCVAFGKMIAQLHAHGLVHGDLTTSNVLVHQAKGAKKLGELVLIDFGLAFHSKKLEDLAVDLVNLKKTYSGTHPDYEKGWDVIQDAYVKNGGKKAVLKKMEEVERRIRYA